MSGFLALFIMLSPFGTALGSAPAYFRRHLIVPGDSQAEMRAVQTKSAERKRTMTPTTRLIIAAPIVICASGSQSRRFSKYPFEVPRG
jgi:hypothetical protein